MVMNTLNIKFAIFSSLLCLLAPFPQLTPCHFPKEGREAIVSEQPQSSFSRAWQPRGIRLHRRADPSTQFLLLFAWGAGILSHFMLHWQTSTSSGFHVMLLQKLSDLPFPQLFYSPLSSSSSLAQAFGLVKPPKMIHTEAPSGKRGVQGCSQPSNLSLPIPGAGERPKAPLHHCSGTFSPLLGQVASLQLAESQNPWHYANGISPSSKLNKTSSIKILLSSKACWYNKTISLRPSYNIFALGAKVLLDSSKMRSI